MSYKKRGTRNMSETFLPANILMPQVDSMKKWAVIACDQFSSQPEYWDEVKEYVGNTPSTLHLMLPEAYLGSEEEDEKIRKIQSTMKNYADDHLLKTYENSLVYVERTLQNGKIRRRDRRCDPIWNNIVIRQNTKQRSVPQRKQLWSESHQE